jgi:hypothetical protein
MSQGYEAAANRNAKPNTTTRTTWRNRVITVPNLQICPELNDYHQLW